MFVVLHFYMLPSEKYGRSLRNMNDRINVKKLQILKQFGGVIIDPYTICLLPLYDKYNIATSSNKSIIGDPSKNTNVIVATSKSLFIDIWDKSFLFARSSLSNAISPTNVIEHELKDFVIVDTKLVYTLQNNDTEAIIYDSYTFINFNKYKYEFHQNEIYHAIQRELLYKNFFADTCTINIYNTLPSFSGLSKDMQNVLDSWNYISTKRIYSDDDDCREFIKNNTPIYLQSYDRIIPGAFKSDIWRLCVLFETGGLYSDTHIRLINPAMKSFFDNF